MRLARSLMSFVPCAALAWATLGLAQDTTLLPPGPITPVHPTPPPGDHQNRWHCTATSFRPHREFVGYSGWFPAGSGQGQAAKQLAHTNALDECRRVHALGCASDINRDCAVERR